MSKIVLLLLSISLQAQAKIECQDTDGGIVAEKRGRVVYSVHPEVCTKGGESKNCFTSSVADSDYCINEKTLLERYCDPKKGPLEKKINCACNDGACAQ